MVLPSYFFLLSPAQRVAETGWNIRRYAGACMITRAPFVTYVYMYTPPRFFSLDAYNDKSLLRLRFPLFRWLAACSLKVGVHMRQQLNIYFLSVQRGAPVRMRVCRDPSRSCGILALAVLPVLLLPALSLASPYSSAQ